MNFTGKVVLVTGGSSGIGAAVAYKFTSEGANVAIVGRNEEKMKQVSQKCEKLGKKPHLIIADISKDESAKRIVSETVNKYGRLDVLVNNAGMANRTSILTENIIAPFDQVMNTNFRAVVNITNQAVKHIIQSKGNIVNISSIAGLGIVTEHNFAYSASKAALDIFTKCIALELAPHGVRVNAISPGPVITDFISNNIANITKEVEVKIWESAGKTTPLKRASDPEEIADLVLHVASEKARGMTGSIIVSDNGAILVGLGELGRKLVR